jgi:hypothetical protein
MAMAGAVFYRQIAQFCGSAGTLPDFYEKLDAESLKVLASTLPAGGALS